MTTLDVRLGALVQRIENLGIGASIDAADLHLPGVLVGIDSVAYDTFAGEPSVVASLDVLVADTDRAGAYRSLGTVIDALSALSVESVASVTNSAGQTIGWRALIQLA